LANTANATACRLGPPVSLNKSSNVTLKDVAKAVGVSAMTVSRVLSGKVDLVNPETAKMCREAAERLGYYPNLMARSLRGEQLKTIVLFAEFVSRHHYLAELVDATFRAIEQRGHSVIVCNSLLSLRQATKNFKLSGAVILAPPEELFAGATTPSRAPREPTVVIHSAFDQRIYNEVSPDIQGLTRSAAQHLLDLGHRQIGFLGGPRIEDEPHWFELRRRGIDEALAKCGNDSAQCRYQSCPDAVMAPASLQQLLAKAPGTTGLLCLSDEIAVGALAGAEELGRPVPQKLSIVGSNNMKLAGFFRPSLTTLEIDIRALVETALDLLFDEIGRGPASQRGEPVRIRLPAKLIVRNSSGPPPA